MAKGRLKGLIYNIQKSKKNIFSSTGGLKGYQVGNKKFPATPDGFSRANVALSKLGVGGQLRYIY